MPSRALDATSTAGAEHRWRITAVLAVRERELPLPMTPLCVAPHPESTERPI